MACCSRKSKQKDGRKLFIQRLCRLFLFSIFYSIAIFMNILQILYDSIFENLQSCFHLFIGHT